MGKIVSNFFMSLDGVVEAPDTWHMPYFDDEMGTAIGKGMETNAGFLMGRVLYDEWASFWPNSDDEFATFFNNHPKYVVSDSLQKADWNNTTIIFGDVPGRLRELKDHTDGDLVMLAPPFVITEAEIDEIVTRFEQALSAPSLRVSRERLEGTRR